MTPQKVLDVLYYYETLLQGREYLEGIRQSRFPTKLADDSISYPIYAGYGGADGEVAATANRKQMRAHLLYMRQEARRFLQESIDNYPGGMPPKIEKAMRWLGFIQGCLMCFGTFSLDDMKKHNMPPVPKEERLNELKIGSICVVKDEVWGQWCMQHGRDCSTFPASPITFMKRVPPNNAIYAALDSPAPAYWWRLEDLVIKELGVPGV